MNTLDQYLEAIADPMAHALTLRAEAAFVLKALQAETFGRVLCVPVRGEAPDALVRLLASVPVAEGGPVLTILVLSGQAGDAPSIGKANEALERFFADSLEQIGQPADLRKYYRAQSGAVLVVDRHGPGRRFATGEGMAGARKLAADLALRFWYDSLVEGDWLSSVDADVILPHDFFAQTDGFAGDAVALSHDAKILGANDDGHISLSVRFDAYAQSGGWPKRDTAELKTMTQALELLGRIVPARGEALLKAPALADTRTARSQGAVAPKRSSLPR